MYSKEKLLKIKQNMNLAAKSLSDEIALQTPELFPTWQIDNTYIYNDRIQYNYNLYRCKQSHTAQIDWTPDVTPALWTLVTPPGEIPVWRQPIGAQDAYQLNDKVYYPTKNDNIWISIIDNNVWEPNIYGWQLFEE